MSEFKSFWNVILLTFELSWIRSYHFDQSRHLTVSNIGKSNQAFHTTEDLFFAMFHTKEL